MNTHTLKNKGRQLSVLSIILITLLVIGFVAIAAGGAFLLFYQPDPDVNNPFDKTPVPQTDSDGNTYYDTEEPGNQNTDNPPSDDRTQLKGKYNFLLVGHDKVSRNTDIMMIISYDTIDNTISIVQIPRDTYVNIDNIKSHKINALYTTYWNRAADAENRAMTALSNLASTVQDIFDVRINYAAVVDLEGFINIIDKIGGVYIDVPTDLKYTDKYQNLYIDIKAGYQWMDGETAMQFVRYRKGYIEQDIGRQNAMKIFMSAVLKQVKENFSVSMVTSVAGEVMNNMTTNISLADFIYFGKSALSVDLSKVFMTTLPGDSAMVDGASVYVLYRADTFAILNEYLNVFDTEMSDADFDSDMELANAENEKVMKFYNMPKGTSSGKVYNADDVNDGSIDIPMRK